MVVEYDVKYVMRITEIVLKQIGARYSFPLCHSRLVTWLRTALMYPRSMCGWYAITFRCRVKFHWRPPICFQSSGLSYTNSPNVKGGRNYAKSNSEPVWTNPIQPGNIPSALQCRMTRGQTEGLSAGIGHVIRRVNYKVGSTTDTPKWMGQPCGITVFGPGYRFS